ncbi:hypothetical protein CALVIDRAFT_361569 [Calocera viscosa TUFC12733]|uniref:Uncharacterized protein n=1 Tax=Calocera viscosa (strain TUFC12733) TaxID=1330018 RepID=A0A167H7C6_CALVF|nr:hypothetical protein CALVIDRAFT_361569 [Calocera viscosa TUFC12733]
MTFQLETSAETPRASNTSGTTPANRRTTIRISPRHTRRLEHERDQQDLRAVGAERTGAVCRFPVRHDLDAYLDAGRAHRISGVRDICQLIIVFRVRLTLRLVDLLFAGLPNSPRPGPAIAFASIQAGGLNTTQSPDSILPTVSDSLDDTLFHHRTSNSITDTIASSLKALPISQIARACHLLLNGP